MSIAEGKKAPVVKLPTNHDEIVDLRDFKDKKNVVLYFYPKDDTPGCTTEACGFRDEYKAIQKEDAVIYGVSPDPVKKHVKFVEKYKLPFPLLSDEDKKVCTKFGVWVEKSMYGRKYMGVARETFIIDKSGKIVKHFQKVKPKDHNKDVLKELRLLNDK